jgi:VWFA-related protein
LGLLIKAAAAAGLPGIAAAQPQRPTPPLDQRSVRFRTGVDLVRLSVTARNQDGQVVRDLKPEEFEVYEDGVIEEVHHFGHEATAISVVLLLDKSGSMMAGDKFMHAKDAVINFVRALKRGDEVEIIAFSDSIDALGGFGLDAKTIERALTRVDIQAGTRLYDAVIEGAREIAGADRKDKRALLILSDGQDTGSVASLEKSVEAVRLAEVPTYAIAIEYGGRGLFPPPTDPLWRPLRSAADLELQPLRRLTDGTGGWTYPVEAAKRCTEICLRVADELRNQYLLAYYPASTQLDGAWRAIEVRTTRPGVTLTTRNGYYAPRS